MTREEIRAEINAKPLGEFVELAESKHGFFCCPVCRSGEGKNGTGALKISQNRGKYHVHCFANQCFGERGTDTLGALRLLWDCSESDVFARLGFSAERQADNTKIVRRGAEFYSRCADSLAHSTSAKNYLQGRGVSYETARACGIGYDSAWLSPTVLEHGKRPFASKRLIVPLNERSYLTRLITEPKTDSEKAFSKMNEGKSDLFHADALYDNDVNTLFVVEGFFDALSILEVTADNPRVSALALNSTSNIHILAERLKYRPTKATLILALDNDEAGRKAQKTLSSELSRLNVPFVSGDICGGCKDANEALQKNRAEFSAAVAETVRKSTNKTDTVLSYLNRGMKEDIEMFKACGIRKTGFSNLDAAAGGLYSGLYVIAALSSLGKTTFAHQLADNLAIAGEDVLFFSMEQSRLELVSKSIARHHALAQVITSKKLQVLKNMKDVRDLPPLDHTPSRVTSLDIRRGFWSDSLQTSLNDYAQKIGDRLSIIEGNFNCTVEYIENYVNTYVLRNGTRPVVIIDYLQILNMENEGRTTKKDAVDEVIVGLKRMSRRLGLTVIVISSINRANYLTAVSFESLKESGSIEFTADVIYGLQLGIINDEIFLKETQNPSEKREKIRQAKMESPRNIQLVCLKNRYGISSFTCNFEYFPEVDLFIPKKEKEEGSTQKRKKV